MFGIGLVINEINKSVYLLNIMNWEYYGFVIGGRCRKKVVLALDIERTPTQIAGITKVNNSHVSRALSELLEKRLVKCLTPKNITGRVYILTKEGKQIRKHLEMSEIQMISEHAQKPKVFYKSEKK